MYIVQVEQCIVQNFKSICPNCKMNFSKSLTLTTPSNPASRDFCEFAEIGKLFKSVLYPTLLRGGRILIDSRSMVMFYSQKKRNYIYFFQKLGLFKIIFSEEQESGPLLTQINSEKKLQHPFWSKKSKACRPFLHISFLKLQQQQKSNLSYRRSIRLEPNRPQIKSESPLLSPHLDNPSCELFQKKYILTSSP